MRPLTGVLLIAALAATATLLPAAGTLAGPAEPSPEVSAPARRAELPVRLQLQFGMLTRAGGSGVRPGKAGFLMTGDLLVMSRSRGPRTWGLGLRVAGDDDCGRYGVSALLRWRLDGGSHGYFQLAPGIDFAGEDNHRTLRLPAGHLTAEIGDDRWLSACVTVEIVPYRHYWLGNLDTYDRYGNVSSVALYDEQGTEVSWYLGGKAHGWKGVVIFLALAVAVSASMSDTGL